MAEDLRELEDVAAGGEEQPGEGVPQIVEPNFFERLARSIAALNGRNTLVLLRGSCSSNLSSFAPGQRRVFLPSPASSRAAR